MKEWTIYLIDGEDAQNPLKVFSDSYEKWFHTESAEWYWKFADGSIVPSKIVKAIINDTGTEDK